MRGAFDDEVNCLISLLCFLQSERPADCTCFDDAGNRKPSGRVRRRDSDAHPENDEDSGARNDGFAPTRMLGGPENQCPTIQGLTGLWRL